MLADGGFATKPDITTISETGQTTVYAPVQRPKKTSVIRIRLSLATARP